MLCLKARSQIFNRLLIVNRSRYFYGNQLLNQIAIVLILTPITTATGKMIPVLVILTMGIEIAIIPVAKLQIIAVLPIFAP